MITSQRNTMTQTPLLNTKPKKSYNVFLGRGNDSSRRSLGNRVFRCIIKEYRSIYQKAPCSQVKLRIAETIIDAFQVLKGTFYVPKNGIWVEATMEQALKRVQQALQGKVVQFRSGSELATMRTFLVEKLHDTSPERKGKSQITQLSNRSTAVTSP